MSVGADLDVVINLLTRRIYSAQERLDTHAEMIVGLGEGARDMDASNTAALSVLSTILAEQRATITQLEARLLELEAKDINAPDKDTGFDDSVMNIT